MSARHRTTAPSSDGRVDAPAGRSGDAGGSTVEHALLIGVVATITVLLASAAEHYVTSLLPSTLPLP